MRRARYFPMVVVGLASFACQATMPHHCRAEDNASAAMYDQSYAPQTDGRIVDESVQQAGYYDSRPRPNSTTMGAPGMDASTTNRKGALFRGQKLRMPTLPFGRQSTTSKPSLRVPQASATQGSPNGALRNQPRVAVQSPVAGRPMPQRTPNASPMAANSSNQNVRMADNRPPQPIREDFTPHPAAQVARPAASTPPIPNSSAVSPWQTTPLAAPTAKPTAVAAKPTVVPTSKPAAPMSPADRLVAEAHELSSQAKSEQEYTRVVETCRRAQASQASPATVQYANNLISWSLNRRGQLKAEAGQEKEALLDFDDAVRADATCWRALHNRGVLFAQAGKFEKGFDDFSRTIQINPQFAKAYSNRAALFMVADHLDAALQDYNHAIELDPNLAVAHRGCGRVCQLLGRVDDAVGHYDAAVQLAPTDAYAAACRADLFTDVGRYSEAVTEYNRAIEIDPKSSQAQGGSAWLLATCPDSSVRNPELAIERAKSAIEIGGEKDAINYDTLGAAQANAGDFTAAMDSVRKAIELAPVDERDAYKDRLLMYQKAKPYRIAPVERVATQVSYEEPSGVEGVAR